MTEAIQLIECPRDAWQGRNDFIPTAKKIEYLQALLRVGFHTIDAGSFVSPKAVPQMADTEDILPALDLSDTDSKLLVILANERGAEQAESFPYLGYWGYPLSVSETFQQRNTKQTIQQGMEMAKRLAARANRSCAELVVYISMGFGNPYGELYHEDQVLALANQLTKMGVETISLADTVGLANPAQIGQLVLTCRSEFSQVNWGVHLHAHPAGQKEKIAAAYQAGCRRFDGALGGYGGCPFAEDELVGNIDTRSIIQYLHEAGQSVSLNQSALAEAGLLANAIFA